MELNTNERDKSITAAFSADPITRLTRDLATAAKTLSVQEARYLVDAYYTMQGNRIAANSQIRALTLSEEPHSVITWLAEQNATLEKQIQRALDKWTDSVHMGRWAKQVVGIGPVISAGLLAHIDIEKAPTVGHIWRFAGLDPTSVWKKGEKRPWNASLKTLCAYKMGESFVKFQGHEGDIYGKYYRQRKDFEIERNERGEMKEEADRILATGRFKGDTSVKACLLTGKLPPVQIHARARRWAVKLFLAHYHAEYFEHHFGRPSPISYVIAHLGHAHFIDRPRFDV